MSGVALIHGEVGIGKTAFMVSNKREGHFFCSFYLASGQCSVLKMKKCKLTVCSMRFCSGVTAFQMNSNIIS